MDLKNIEQAYSDYGCQKIYVKTLAPNDNSKNQVYLGGSFDILNIFPITKIENESPGDWKRERFKAAIDFGWLGEDGNIYPAPNSQLILYPKYPEVRFSGFLNRCENPPSELMTQRLSGRLLFLGVTKKGNVIGYVTSPISPAAAEFMNTPVLESYGLFSVIELSHVSGNRKKLLDELLRIHESGWISSKRLDRDGNILPCLAPNCGGYTLEAELGITPNGYAEPDYLGWEIKQFGVSDFERINNAIITLMTPEPTHGYYVNNGTEAFIRKYGYEDLRGREDRMNFGGIHKCGLVHPRTSLKLELVGFDYDQNKIRSTDGCIALIDSEGNEAASWSFSTMLVHWNRKHNQACYIPSKSALGENRRYMYGNNVIMGEGTDFLFFLSQMACGNIYYDPGIKMENVSTHPHIKKRSQFRIKSSCLSRLYKKSFIISLSNPDNPISFPK